MNLPARTTREGGGVAAAQLEGIAGVGNGLVGLSNDHAIDAHATRENPLFGATLRSLRMLAQQPIQQGAGVRFDRGSDHPASPSSRSALDPFTLDPISGCAAGIMWSG